MSLDYLIALAAQELHDDRAHQLLVLDHKNAAGTAMGGAQLLFGFHHALAPRRSASVLAARAGRQIVTAVPWPTSLSTLIVPRLPSTMRWQSERPSPVPAPAGFVVKNGSKTRARCSGGMPMPLSITFILTLRACVRGSGVKFSVTIRITAPSFGAASAALNNRFSSTC